MDQQQQKVISIISNQISMQPVANMQQLVSHWSTIVNTDTPKRKRGHDDINPQTGASEPLATNNRSKRKILTRP